MTAMPLFSLKDTGLCEPHVAWLGRKVHDPYGRMLGRIRDILVADGALHERDDPRAWRLSAAYAVMTVGSNWLPLSPRREVLIPIAELEEHGLDIACTIGQGDISLRLAA